MLQHVLEEVRKADTLYDIMEHPLFGSLIRKGREEGHEEGREVGREEGREAGREEGVRAEAVRLALRLLTSRFGTLPEGLKLALERMATEKLEDVCVRSAAAEKLEDLIP